MGREARATVEVDGAHVPVSLHLDGRALELRGGLRRRIAREEVRAVVADGGRLTVRTPDGDVVLDLGAQAAAWATALMTPPPSLADKLGLSGGPVVLVLGQAPPEVAAVLGTTTSDAAGAALVVATVRSAAELDALPATLAGRGGRLPVWVVHGKGRSPAPGADAVRTRMRAAGYRDTKVSAVSDEWSATRHHPRA